MKYSVFLSQLIYVEVELEAEDPTDAAQRVVLAAVTEADFLERNPDYIVDEIEAEVVTVADKTAVNSGRITAGDFNGCVVLFDAETVNSWLGELSGHPVITEEGRRALGEL